jgi:hypothetical protein
MMLSGMKVYPNEGEEDSKHLFTLSRGDKKLLLAAQTKDDKAKWISEINSAKRLATTVSVRTDH